MIQCPPLNVSGLLVGVYVRWRARVSTPNPSLIALAVHGPSGFLFRWTIVSRCVLCKMRRISS